MKIVAPKVHQDVPGYWSISVKPNELYWLTISCTFQLDLADCGTWPIQEKIVCAVCTFNDFSLLFDESFCDMFFYPGNVSCFIFVFPFSPAVLRFGSVVAAFAHKMAPFSINPRGGGNWSNFDRQNLRPWDPGGFSF